MFKNLFDQIVSSKRKEIPFIIFFTFLVTFLCARLFVHFIQIGYLPEWLMLHIRGIHIHHLAYGIIILSISGFLSLIDTNRKHLYQITIFYGIGLGLSFDEFGMWIMLENNYWHRLSYDAIIIISAFFLNIVYFIPFWKKIGKVARRILKFPINIKKSTKPETKNSKVNIESCPAMRDESSNLE